MDLSAPASLLDAIDPRLAMVDVLARLEGSAPLSASYVADLVATRPVGGKRRALGAPDSALPKGARPGGKRARRNSPESILVDAADAANHLGLAASTWDATQILAHAEITRLALTEALRNLAVERDEIETPGAGIRRVRRRNRRAAHTDIQRRAGVILQAAELLAAAHDRDLVRGD